VEAAGLVREYLSIAAGLDRLLPGFLDAYGPRPGRASSPSELVRAAGRLAAAVPDAVEPARAEFLRGQVVACEWAARRLAGQAVPFVEEVRAAFGVRIALGSEDAYRAAHRALDDLLPGSGPLAGRVAAHRVREEIPPASLRDAVRALSGALRERTLALVDLPAGECVVHRIVEDAPWSALHRYRGGFSSVVTVNAGARLRAPQLAQLVAHEIYPGHHTERCRKEAGLVARGWDEHRAVLVNTPQSLVAEGAAELGMHAVVGPGWGLWAADVLAGAGVRFDGELAERVGAATSALARVRQDAALLLHDRRKPDAEVLAFLRRWLLVGEPRAAAALRFLRHPLWRAYTVTYVEGSDLLRRWWDAGAPAERLRGVLDEPLTPRVLAAESQAFRTRPDAAPDGRQPYERKASSTTTGGVQEAMSGRPFC
jgi:hypothetical protein